MLEVGSFRSQSCDGISRRSFVKVGATLPWTLPALLHPASASASTNSKAKSVILLWLWGGPSHLDTFDPKPNAQSNVRSPFKTVSTSVPGFQLTELLPKLAQRADKFSLVRSCRFSGNHDMLCLTGARGRGGSREPNFGSIISQASTRTGLPPFISVAPRTNLSHGFPCISVPGFDAGRLGAAYNPFIVRCASDADVEIPSLKLANGLTPNRLEDRKFLLGQLDLLKASMQSDQIDVLDKNHSNAYSLLTSGESFQAFDLSREPERTHQAYGKTAFGKSAILGRRLVEAGVPYVQINWSLGVDGLEEGPLMGWDTHRNGFGQLMTYHCPIFDRVYSTLLDDLEDRGLLDSTLVVAMGEMGRSPKINNIGGREHWATCTTLWAGGGVDGGKIIGKTDRIGGEPITSPVSPLMAGTTIAEAMGIDSEARAKLRVLAGGSVVDDLLS